VEIHLLRGDTAEIARLALFLSEVPGVMRSAATATGAAFVHAGDPEFKAELLGRLLAERFKVTDFHSATSDLEDAFIALTGAAIDNG